MRLLVLKLFVMTVVFGVLSQITPAQAVLYQHKLAGQTTCEKNSFTCTINLGLPIVTGHALMLGIAGAGLNGYPVVSSVTGGGNWVHCPNSNGHYLDDPTDYVVTDCFYLLSAVGGASSITVQFSGGTAEAMDAEVMEVSYPGYAAVFDASGWNASTYIKQCTSCTSAALPLTGTTDAILQVADMIQYYKGIAAPYALLDADTDGNAFSYMLNTGNGAGAVWTQTSPGEQMVLTSVALKFVPTGVGVAPQITTDPSNETVTLGQTATFVVVAEGTAPLTYQWEMNGSPINGATSASYTTPATTTVTTSKSSAQQFSVVVSNDEGSVTSNSATLTVTSSTPAYTCSESSVSSTSEVITCTITNFSSGESISITDSVTHP